MNNTKKCFQGKPWPEDTEIKANPSDCQFKAVEAGRFERMKIGEIMVALRAHLHAVLLLDKPCFLLSLFPHAQLHHSTWCQVPMQCPAFMSLHWHTHCSTKIGKVAHTISRGNLFYFLQRKKQWGSWGQGELCDPFFTTTLTVCVVWVFMYMANVCMSTAGVCVYI